QLGYFELFGTPRRRHFTDLARASAEERRADRGVHAAARADERMLFRGDEMVDALTVLFVAHMDENADGGTLRHALRRLDDVRERQRLAQARILRASERAGTLRRETERRVRLARTVDGYNPDAVVLLGERFAHRASVPPGSIEVRRRAPERDEAT